MLGLGLVLRSTHLRATLETLDAVRDLQKGARQAPRPPLHDPRAALRPVEMSPLHGAKPDIRPVEGPAPRIATKELRASKNGPTGDKPMKPHPIFSARPPR